MIYCDVTNEKRLLTIPVQAFICLALLFICPALIWGQGPSGHFVEAVSKKGGMQDNHILTLEQDKAGFLWVGTGQGLYRYDGYNFRPFFSKAGDSTSLSNDVATYLFKDRNEQLWVCTGNGLNRFNAKESTFRRYFTWPEQTSERVRTYIMDGCDDAKGRIWLRNHINDIFILDPISGKMDKWRLPDGAEANFSVLDKGLGNQIWLGRQGSICQLNTETMELRWFDPGRADLPAPTDIRVVSQDWVWVVFEKKAIGRLNLKNGTWTYFSVTNPTFTGETLPEGSESILIGCTNTVERHRLGESTVTTISLPNDPEFDAEVKIIFRDRSGITWFGTENGLFKLDPFLQGFQKVPVHTQTAGLIDNDIADVQQFPGSPYLFAISRRLNMVFVLRDQPGGAVFVKSIPTHPYTAPNDLWRARDGTVWLLCAERLLRFDPLTFRMTPAPPFPVPPGQKALNKHAAEDAKGNIWIATSTDKIFIFDPATEAYSIIGPEQGQPAKRIIDIWMDKNGRYAWFGTDLNGFVECDLTTMQFRHFTEKDAPGLNNSGYCQPDNDGNVWIGGDKGLLCYNPATKKFELAFSRENGLSANNTRGGLRDKNGDLWWGLSDRILRISPRQRTFKIFDDRYGIGRTPYRLTRFSQNAETGEVFAGLRGAFLRWHPDSLRANNLPPPVVNIACRYRDKEIFAPMDSAWNMRFRHEDNSFSMEFAALNFTLPEDNLYSWRLEGFSNDWSPPNRERYFQANFVPPGTYKLFVRAANNDGAWNEQAQGVSIEVLPAWWQTWWFRSLAALLILCSLYGIYRYRHRERLRLEAVKARAKELEKQQLLNEIDLLKSQVNPHFLFNSLSILSSLVHVNADLSEQFIEQLARSYRYILEQKDQRIVTLRTELDFIHSYAFLLKIRFENKFQLQLDLEESVLDTCQIAPLTLQLLVENAVKHNRMSTQEPLVVRVFIENDYLIVQNRLQRRSVPEVSTGTGLGNIINRYALITDKPVWAGEIEDSFVVRVPLI
ncbi:MAG: histidine kinase [Lewinellaceae bacterium]|nr:histidine kinase [Lewinellaceae bacterium]